MRKVIIFYIVAIHFVLGVALVKTDLIPRVAIRLGVRSPPEPVPPPELGNHFHSMLMYHKWIAPAVPDASFIFIGDSITQGLCVTAVTPNAVNFGIGGDTTVGVLERLPVYQHCLANASAVILAIGVNDLRHRPNDEILENYNMILDSLINGKVYVCSILPVDESAAKWLNGYNDRISQLNTKLSQIASARNLQYVDSANLLDSNHDQALDRNFHIGDGVHLSPDAYSKWIALLRDSTAN